MRLVPQPISASFFTRIFAGMLLTCSLSPFFAVSASLAAPELEKDRIFQQYRTLKKNSLAGPVYRLQDSLLITLPDMTVTLRSGLLRYLQGDDSLRAGFVFAGRGTAHFAPRHPVEQKQLTRFIDRDLLQAEFDLLVVKNVLAGALPPQLEIADPAEASIENAGEFASSAEASLLERAGFNLPSRMLTEFVLGPTGITACIFRDISERKIYPPIYYYFHDPASFEQVQLMLHRPKSLGKPFYTVCRYPLDDYLASPPESNTRIAQYNGWVEIDGDGKIVADLGVEIVAGSQPLKTLHFQLSKLLKLEWATSVDGDSLPFIQEKHQAGFTLFLPQHLTPVDTLRLNFHYAGDILEKGGANSFYLKDPTHWHPRLGYLRRARYRIIYKYPHDVDLVANGQLLREWQEGDVKHSYYFQRVPAKASMFLLGKFRRANFFGPNRVAVSVFSASRHDSNVLRAVNRDIVSSLYLFSQNIAPYEYEHISIIEAPGIESQGFPGFVKLSNLAFREQRGGTLATIRSHEIAHQWWGNLVGWRSYRDQWLSESFAEYMGALYLAYHLPGEKQFQQILAAWRDDLLEGGNIGVSLGLKRFGFSKDALRNSNVEKAGPIYLGVRLGQRESAEYYLLVYQKGAYLLHTLRNYLRDDRSGSDEKFWQLLRDYASTYAGRDPATKNFIEMASKHAGEDMDWFFEQWLLGQDIPKYRYSHEIRQTADGYRIDATIQVEHVDARFKSFLPIRISFADTTAQRTRVVFTGNEFAHEFGPFDRQPTGIEFNCDRAVLARD